MKKSQFRFLYGFALKKSAGWIAIYSILLTLCYPLIVWTENYKSAVYYPNNYERYVNYAMTDHTASAVLVSMLMCSMVLVFSAVLYSYMHGKRSADFFHSMPVERSTMLTANFGEQLDCNAVLSNFTANRLLVKHMENHGSRTTGMDHWGLCFIRN